MTILVRTIEPASWFPYALTGQLGMMPSPEVAGRGQGEPRPQPAAGGHRALRLREPGPRRQHQVRAQRGLLGRRGLPRRRRVLPRDDSARRADQLLAGDLDEMHTTTANDIVRMREDDDVQMTEEDLGEESFVMINSSQPPFDDIRVREALTLATPRERYIDVIGEGILSGADQMFHPSDPFYNPDVTQAADDPAAAQPLAGRVLRRESRSTPTATRSASTGGCRSRSPSRPPARCRTRSWRCCRPAGARAGSTSSSTTCPRTATSCRSPVVTGRSTRGASSGRPIRAPTRSGCGAARSAGSR